MPSCRICEKPVCARGLCRRHYTQAWGRGDHLNFETKDRGTLEERFSTKYAVVESGCWEWQGHLNDQGYPMIWHEDKAVRAHRVAFELFNGPVSGDEVICHRCDNPKCVNPTHLFKGTRLDNNLDCSAKGRRPRGTSHWNSKLTESDIKAILESKERTRVLATRYSVDYSHIYRLRHGQTKRRQVGFARHWPPS